MSGGHDYIDVECVDTQIVVCEKCRSKNRIRLSSQHQYRCGNCHHPIRVKEQVTTAAPPKKSKLTFSPKQSVIICVVASAIIIFWIIKATEEHEGSANSPAYAAPAPQYYRRSLPSGTVLRQLYSHGRGQLTIDNGTDRDAVVKLIGFNSQFAACSFYVQANTSHILSGVPDGSFSAIYSLGEDWDGNRFTRNQSFGKYDKPLDFLTRTVTDENYVHTYYSTFSLTLHKVFNGNATTHTISEAEFNKF